IHVQGRTRHARTLPARAPRRLRAEGSRRIVTRITNERLPVSHPETGSRFFARIGRTSGATVHRLQIRMMSSSCTRLRRGVDQMTNRTEGGSNMFVKFIAAAAIVAAPAVVHAQTTTPTNPTTSTPTTYPQDTTRSTTRIHTDSTKIDSANGSVTTMDTTKFHKRD